jgi:uncharacterized damage-inducible protein DinB
MHPLTNELREGPQLISDLLAGVDDDQARLRREPTSWSILEIIDHLVISERFLFLQFSNGKLGLLPERDRDAAIRRVGLDRKTRPVASPREGEPSGEFRTLREALSALGEARAATLRSLEERAEEDHRARWTTHPIAGEVTCHEILLMMSIHPIRHAGQIREMLDWIRDGEKLV